MTVLLICSLIGSIFYQSASGLEGTWTGSFKNQEGMAMTITWTFNDGTYTMDMIDDGLVDVKGKYEIADNTLYTWDLSGRVACPEDQKGTYTFKIDGDKLKVTLVEDKCPGRSMISPKVDWSRE